MPNRLAAPPTSGSAGTSAPSGSGAGSKPGTVVSTGNRLQDKLLQEKVCVCVFRGLIKLCLCEMRLCTCIAACVLKSCATT